MFAKFVFPMSIGVGIATWTDQVEAAREGGNAAKGNDIQSGGRRRSSGSHNPEAASISYSRSVCGSVPRLHRRNAAAFGLPAPLGQRPSTTERRNAENRSEQNKGSDWKAWAVQGNGKRCCCCRRCNRTSRKGERKTNGTGNWGDKTTTTTRRFRTNRNRNDGPSIDKSVTGMKPPRGEEVAGVGGREATTSTSSDLIDQLFI